MEMFVATFGSGQKGEGHYILIEAKTREDARFWMHDNYGDKWCGLYSWDEWQDWVKRATTIGYPVETMLMKVVAGGEY